MTSRYSALENARLNLVRRSTYLRLVLAGEGSVVIDGALKAERLWRVGRMLTHLICVYHGRIKRPATKKQSRHRLLIAGAVGAALAIAATTWPRRSKHPS